MGVLANTRCLGIYLRATLQSLNCDICRISSDDAHSSRITGAMPEVEVPQACLFAPSKELWTTCS